MGTGAATPGTAAGVRSLGLDGLDLDTQRDVGLEAPLRLVVEPEGITLLGVDLAGGG